MVFLMQGLAWPPGAAVEGLKTPGLNEIVHIHKCSLKEISVFLLQNEMFLTLVAALLIEKFPRG